MQYPLALNALSTPAQANAFIQSQLHGSYTLSAKVPKAGPTSNLLERVLSLKKLFFFWVEKWYLPELPEKQIRRQYFLEVSCTQQTNPHTNPLMTVHCAKLLFSRKNLEDKTELLPFNLLQYELSLDHSKTGLIQSNCKFDLLLQCIWKLMLKLKFSDMLALLSMSATNNKPTT